MTLLCAQVLPASRVCDFDTCAGRRSSPFILEHLCGSCDAQVKEEKEEDHLIGFVICTAVLFTYCDELHEFGVSNC